MFKVTKTKFLELSESSIPRGKRGTSVLLMIFEVLVAGLFIFVVLDKVSDIGNDNSIRKERAAKDNALLIDAMLAVSGELNLNYPEDQLVNEFRQDEADAYVSGDILTRRKAFRFVPNEGIILKESKIERETTDEVRFSLLNVRKAEDQIVFGEEIEIKEACQSADTMNLNWQSIDFQVIGKKELIGDQDYDDFLRGVSINFRNFRQADYFDETGLGIDFLLNSEGNIVISYSSGNKEFGKLGKLSCVLRKKLIENGFDKDSIAIKLDEEDALKRNFALRIDIDESIVSDNAKRSNFVSAFNNAAREYYG